MGVFKKLIKFSHVREVEAIIIPGRRNMEKYDIKKQTNKAHTQKHAILSLAETKDPCCVSYLAVSKSDVEIGIQCINGEVVLGDTRRAVGK